MTVVMRALLPVVVAVLLVCPLAAQESDDPGAESKVSAPQADRTTDAQTGTQTGTQRETQTETQTASSPPAVDASKPPSDSPWRALLYYSAYFTEREGFPEAEFGGSSTLASVSARVAVSRPKFRTFIGSSFLLEHSSWGTEATMGTNGFLGPTFSYVVALSRRWSWDFSLGLGYGADIARSFLFEDERCEGGACPQRVTAEQGYLKMEDPSGDGSSIAAAAAASPMLGDVPALPRPDTLVVRSVTSTAMTLGLYGSTGLSWRRSSRQQFSLRFSHGESAFLNGNPQSNDMASAKAVASQDLSPLTMLSAYGQVHHYFQDNGCTFYGSGVGIWHSLNEKTYFSAEAGPEYGDHSCNQRLGLNFSGAVRSRVTRRMSLAAAGGRDLSAYYIAGNRWANYAQGSAMQRTGASTSVSLTAGYLSSEDEFRKSSTYSGYYVSPQLRWQINRQWDLLASYRYFQSNSQSSALGSRGFAVNWFYLTLQWLPPALKL